MENYKNVGGGSGIMAYEYGVDYVRVKFSDGHIYLYTNSSAGCQNIAKMKKLANEGKGLNSFINRNVRNLYQQKEC
ncbi:hypothetical protein AGMMS50212_09770 [Spirochaetia bacterium]|nr:hypothetical protein AGMMS50212_09770 [Spirochaetia bacterium]